MEQNCSRIESKLSCPESVTYVCPHHHFEGSNNLKTLTRSCKTAFVYLLTLAHSFVELSDFESETRAIARKHREQFVLQTVHKQLVLTSDLFSAHCVGMGFTLPPDSNHVFHSLFLLLSMILRNSASRCAYRGVSPSICCALSSNICADNSSLQSIVSKFRLLLCDIHVWVGFFRLCVHGPNCQMTHSHRFIIGIL